MLIIEKLNCNSLSIDYHGIKLFFISPEQFLKSGFTWLLFQALQLQDRI